MLVDIKNDEKEVLDSIRKMVEYDGKNFKDSYYKQIALCNRLVTTSKLYILDNYKKVKDYSKLSLFLYAANHEDRRIHFGEKIKSRIGKNVSPTVKKILLKVENEIIEIKSFDEAIYDWTDGDFSVTFNNIDYNWIDDESIIDIADFIDQSLKEKSDAESK
jgi:hypothetical protein